MTYLRLPYDDPASTAEMTSDCAAAGASLRRAAVRPAPSIRYDDYPREVRKPTIEVSEAASRLAAAIHPYLD
jgi:hypothetical protein